MKKTLSSSSSSSSYYVKVSVSDATNQVLSLIDLQGGPKLYNEDGSLRCVSKTKKLEVWGCIGNDGCLYTSSQKVRGGVVSSEHPLALMRIKKTEIGTYEWEVHGIVETQIRFAAQPEVHSVLPIEAHDVKEFILTSEKLECEMSFWRIMEINASIKDCIICGGCRFQTENGELYLSSLTETYKVLNTQHDGTLMILANFENRGNVIVALCTTYMKLVLAKKPVDRQLGILSCGDFEDIRDSIVCNNRQLRESLLNSKMTSSENIYYYYADNNRWRVLNLCELVAVLSELIRLYTLFIGISEPIEKKIFCTTCGSCDAVCPLLTPFTEYIMFQTVFLDNNNNNNNDNNSNNNNNSNNLPWKIEGESLNLTVLIQFLQIFGDFSSPIVSPNDVMPIHRLEFQQNTNDHYGSMSVENRYNFDPIKVHKILCLFLLYYSFDETVNLEKRIFQYKNFKPQVSRRKMGQTVNIQNDILIPLTRILQNIPFDFSEPFRLQTASIPHDHNNTTEKSLIFGLSEGFPEVRDKDDLLVKHYYNDEKGISSLDVESKSAGLMRSNMLNISYRLGSDISPLAGHAIYVEDKKGLVFVDPIDLPDKLRERLVTLFKLKKKIYEEELQFLLSPIIIEDTRVAALITRPPYRFCRVISRPDQPTIFTSWNLPLAGTRTRSSS